MSCDYKKLRKISNRFCGWKKEEIRKKNNGRIRRVVIVTDDSYSRSDLTSTCPRHLLLICVRKELCFVNSTSSDSFFLTSQNFLHNFFKTCQNANEQLVIHGLHDSYLMRKFFFEPIENELKSNCCFARISSLSSSPRQKLISNSIIFEREREKKLFVSYSKQMICVKTCWYSK